MSASARTKADVKLLPAYLVVGTNELMTRETLAHLRGYLEAGLEVFNFDERTAGSAVTAGELLASLNTVPVGTGPRIVMIHEAEHLPKATSEALIAYLANPNPGCILCLVAASLARTTRLYKAVAKVGPHAVIDCSPKKRWELPKQVTRMAQARDIHIDADAIEELIARVGESATMLVAQVTTLAELCRTTGHVSRADVEVHVARTAEVRPWDFLDAVCERDAARALTLYRLMAKPSQIALTSLLTGRLRELICAKALVARGASAQLASVLGKRDWQVQHHLHWVERFSQQELRDALMACAECERALKTGADSETTFVMLVMSICRGRERS